MPRPIYIAALHEAKYEFRFSPTEENRLRYAQALVEASRQSGLAGPLIEAAVARDYGIWCKQEKLPRTQPGKENQG